MSLHQEVPAVMLTEYPRKEHLFSWYLRILSQPMNDEDDEGAQVAKDTDPYYHILERSESEDHNCDNQVGSTIVAQSSQESPEPDGYRELSLEGQVYTGYQALHKYTYISAREPAVK